MAQPQHWSVEGPKTIDVTGVRKLSLRLVAGEADVVASTSTVESGGTARVEVHKVEGPPLTVALDADGTLNVVHDRLTWGGLLQWLSGPTRARVHVSVSVPQDTEVELGVVSADATVTGVSGRTSVKSVSGEVTLDGCAGEVKAETVSGGLEARSLDGRLQFKSISGELTVVDGSTTSLTAHTVSGEVVIDLTSSTGDVDLKTVSGDLTLRLPSDVSLALDAKTVSGHLTATGFDQVSHDRAPGSKKMTGEAGGGRSKLWAKTVSGDVTVLRREA
ncbi:MAG: hypothetical protein QOK42_2857 [Frankiaceae bacterium]|jgi:hypothetical protein|nr:hypothetical protein [Frankiaceae bacterium]